MKRWCLYIALLGLWSGAVAAAKPTFENGTPVGFAPQDSTTWENFVSGEEISVRVDLNQAVTEEYPVVGHFHTVEKSVQLGSVDTDGMQVDIAMMAVAPFGNNSNWTATGDPTAPTHPTIHMAWIEETTSLPRPGFPYSNGTTPVYKVMYARSSDGGATFSAPTSVSNSVTFHLLTFANGGFTTLDLEVDSEGNPRLAYAFVSTADRERNKNVYFSYSQDGGSNWKPDPGVGESLILVNDPETVAVTEGKSCAFPRMAIDDRDNIFISYVRGTSDGGGDDDVMLAKVNRFTSPFSIVPAGATAPVGTGGVRLTIDGERQIGPDIAVGDGDALHLIYFSDDNNQVEHKRMSTDTTWVDVSTAGWDNTATGDGALVAAFVDEEDPLGALEMKARYYFPTVVVDRQPTPNRVYALFKYGGDNTDPVEGIYFNQYDDNGTTGTGASWGTAGSAWNTSGTALFADAANQYNIELDWEITERVATVVDDRTASRGDLHIAFTAGYSNDAGEHDIYYARYNGTSWSLPEKVADDDSDSGTEDGIGAADVFLSSPALAWHPDTDNIILAFAGGVSEGFGVDDVLDVDQHAYFKVLGRDVTYEDISFPVGAYQYNLAYTPINPHDAGSEVADNPVYVHVADLLTGRGLGARADTSDGFLAGDWERVGSTLADDDKYFEGLIDEDNTSTHEWGDDDDKIGLLVKLNVLGSDSATNVQVVTNSTASDAGTGEGARTVRVGTDPTGTFVAAGSFFVLGADIDIVDANTAPVVSISEPDGTDDEANTEYNIKYTLTDGDVGDDLGGSLQVALYAFPTNSLTSVQDIRIFGTLIVDENDVTSVNANGTNDLTEGGNQTYTWDDPPAALKSSALFASILRVKSGNYYIYIVADDGKNQPSFAVSSGPVTVLHSPIVRQIDPTNADIVDTGVRSGLQANPYDLDFNVVDYDTEARVQLFYASASGITSLSVKGTYPRQTFVLGKSLAGTQGTAIVDSTDLTSRDTEYSWDITDPLIAEGSYYLYAVATDSVSVTVGNSAQPLVVKHSPSFVFYEPAKDTQREIDSGSQPFYTIQWQKGPGDEDLDHDATIDLYFTTDDPATIDHATDSGAASNSLTLDADTRVIVAGLSEDGDPEGDREDDIYPWNLRVPPNDIPVSGQQVWIYAVVTDGVGNVTVARGGSLTITHSPFILLETRMPSINQGDIVRLEWDDYMVDDLSGTDDAYIRLYASVNSGYATLQELETALTSNSGRSYIVNSSDGSASGTITAIRESSDNAFNWDTATSGLALPVGNYTIYAGISADPTFSDNTTGRLSKAVNPLSVGVGAGTTPHLSLSPSKVQAAVGDILTFEILMQSGGQTAESISIAIDLSNKNLIVQDSHAPFTDLGEVFSVGSTVMDNSTASNVIRFTKNKPGGEVVGTTQTQKRLASFQLKVDTGFSGTKSVSFDGDETGLGIAGSPQPLNGLSVQNGQIKGVSRGRIQATVLLEGRSSPLGNGDHGTLLDVHLRQPGSTVDLIENRFWLANDDAAGADTVEVQTTSAGALTLTSVPTGRYVLTVKDTSHLSGRTDTLVVRNGETISLSASQGFFASDIRGNPSFLLAQDGRQLKAGDVTEDNEIDEDDVNAIDAAWGTDDNADYFDQADLNNDLKVGVEDLTVTSSNVGNSIGFGAPPVYKRATPASNAAAGIQVLAPGHAGEWRRGEEVELLFLARDLGDLAGYGFELAYDPLDVELVDDDLQLAGVFQENPGGFSRRVESREGRLAVAAARRGRAWSAAGTGELLRVRVKLHQDGFPASLQIEDGQLLSSLYESTPLRLLEDPRQLALPGEFALRPNYPNPFNPSTTIPFNVPSSQAGALPGSVEIFNALGQRVRTLMKGMIAPGYYRTVWDGQDGTGQPVASGLYFYRVEVGELAQVGRMTLVK